MRIMISVLFALVFPTTVLANLPYFPVTFPRDEAAHYTNVPYPFTLLVEWWYFNGKVTTDDGRHLSYDIALFNPAYSFDNVATLPILHIQIADLDRKRSLGTSTLFPMNSGKISTDTLDISVYDHYHLRKIAQNGKTVYLLNAYGKENDTTLKLDLVLEPNSSPFLINENGLMPMPDQTNSYYYTIPRFKTTGMIYINDTSYQVSREPGDSWMDHQWGDFNLQKTGWEWFSVRLDNGLIANIFLDIDFKSKKAIGGLANIILPNGEKQYIPYEAFSVTRDNYWFDKKLSLSYPMTYTFHFPTLGLEFVSNALFPDQENNRYWEGYCDVKATFNKATVNGFSYTEIVYENPLSPLKMDTLRNLQS